MAVSSVKIGSIDLNLLIVFDAIAQERSVTRAGNQLGLSQSAISHALARLRHMLKDELFISSPKGMVPTPRAEQLARPVREALDGLTRSLEPPEFDPAKAIKTFRISVNNFAAVVLVAPLIARIRKIAPRVTLDIVPSGEVNVGDLLDDGKLDLVIGTFDGRLQRFSYLSLRREGYAAIMCKDLAGASRRPLSLKELAERQHLEITSIHPGTEFIDEALASRNHVRKIAFRTPLLAAAPALCDSDLLAIVPLGLAKEMVRRFPHALGMRRLPFETETIETAAVWPRWLDSQPSHIWLRENVRVAVESLDSILGAAKEHGRGPKTVPPRSMKKRSPGHPTRGV